MSLLVNAAVAHMNRQFHKKPSNEIITEELSDVHKKKIANMPSTNRNIKLLHDRVFGEGNDTVEIPYSRENDKKITSDNFRSEINTGGFNAHQAHHNYVFTHLHRKGYHVTDYVNGLARQKTEQGEPEAREEKIGKILQKTDAHEVPTFVMSKPTYKRVEKEDGTTDWARDHRGQKIVDKAPSALNVVQAFANDPIRAAKKDVKLVVTRSKEGVGGMSSGKGWTSCMDLDNGCNRHFVPHDIQQGTLTAYLVRKGDEKNMDNPAGRINLKQFSNSTGSHSIFRPESATYGAMPKSAHHAVSTWAETMYPHKEDEIYNKHASLYNDDGNGMVITGNPDHNKLASAVDHHVTSIMRSFEDRGYKHNDEDDVSDHVENYLGNLPEKHKENLVIHHRLTAQDDPDEKWSGDMSSDDHIAKWAHERSVNWGGIHEKDLMHHLNTAEENSKYGHSYDSKMLSDSTYVHNKLLNEVLKRGSPEVKDKAISHMLNNHQNNWYQQMDNDWGGEIPHVHKHTDNPANIKKIYEVSKDGTMPNTIPEFSDMDIESQGKLAQKVGKHGDDDVLHEFTHSDHYNEDHYATRQFHKGLNDRADGEERQHKLIAGLHLGGGSGHGEIKPITTKIEMQNAAAGMHREHQSDEGDDNLYANIAEHTKFPSVHTALKNRTDTQTPEIQSALKQNEHLK